MIIDVHAHALTREFLSELARDNTLGIETKGDGFGFGGYGPLDPLLYDVQGAAESLVARDITLQLVSPPPRIVSHASWGADRAFARRLNRQTADFVKQAGSRHGGLAVPALTEPEFAVAEISRALDEDGLTGVALPTTAVGRPLDDPAFEPLFAECARRGVIVFMHPTTGVERPAFGQYTMLQLVGWPSETALCVSRLIFAGVFERHPGLKLVLAHGGGTLAMLAGRLDLAYEAPHYEANPDCRKNISRPPSSYLKQIYFDTVVAHPAALRYLIELVGHEQIVFGSDFPFEIGDPVGAKALPAIAKLPDNVAADILYNNAAKILSGAKAGRK
ncbi:MAG: amidohydrolase [Bradyrhizobium sp.]|jgi:aminocarboxymuconate-semialdehyde decarboxylase|nr:amidohydrolase [Bradyrhizobium sp.]